MSHESPSFAAVIGDVVASRAAPDQGELLDAVAAALEWANQRIPAAQPLQPTVGDELQGVYRDLPSALLVTLLLRLRLWEKCQLRFGVGWGEITRPTRAEAGQSGSAWWGARQAIEHVAAIETGRKGFPDGIRTFFAGGESDMRSAVNAFLICRDQILSRMDAKDARIAMALFEGESQSTVARELAITQSTVSARQRRNGPSALYRAHLTFETPGAT
jgi:hypothetical protein